MKTVGICHTVSAPPQLHGTLHAYDPQTLTKVWTSQESIDRAYWFAKFVGPTVMPDALLLPTFSNKVLIYGSLSMYDAQTRSAGKIAAVKRDDQQEDIFVVGRDGIAYTSFVRVDPASRCRPGSDQAWIACLRG